MIRLKHHSPAHLVVGENLVDILRQRASEQHAEVALRFLAGDTQETMSLTYGEFDLRVRTAAAWLQQRGLVGERAILVYPTGPEYAIAILACLYAGVIAVPLPPCLPNRSIERLRTVCQDAEPAVALTTPTSAASVAEQLAGHDLTVEVLDLSQADSQSALRWQPLEFNADALAYLQYTSGSTKEPKGVMITHGNVLHNCELIARVVDSTVAHVIVSWLPFFHDMGLVGGLFFPLLMGYPLVLMPPETFVMRPVTWLKAISQYRGTLSPAPNFAFELCVDRITSQQRDRLDLSSWQFAFNGAERINSLTLERFAEAFAPCGFRLRRFMPCYGLAESTLLVSCGVNSNRPAARTFRQDLLNQGRGVLAVDGVTLVSCGNAREQIDVLIVDPDSLQLCPEGKVGEIWISGKSVAAGYWRQPKLSAERFEAYEQSTGKGPYLRTGDLGFVTDDELFVTGRLKDLVIIGGQNLCPDDVELTVETAHAAIRSSGAIAFSLETSASETLAVVAEVDRRSLKGASLNEIEGAIREAVARTNNVAVGQLLLLRGPAVPRTLSGKKRRSECRKMFLHQEFQKHRFREEA